MESDRIEPALPFPSEPLRGERLGVRAVCGRLAFWSPVWIPLALLAQIALLGLSPARDEAQRLEQAGAMLDERLERELGDRQSLERVLRAQDDPIYLERERRLLRAQAPSSGSASARAPSSSTTRPTDAR
jgi:hypothetical protein